MKGWRLRVKLVCWAVIAGGVALGVFCFLAGLVLGDAHALFRAWLILLPATLAVIAAISAILLRKAIEPVRKIAAAAARIDPRRGDERLPATGTNDEIGRLTEVLNEMLARARQSFVQMERFSADTSHELKTPLTIIRGEIESAMRAGDLPPAIEKTMSDLLEETGRLIHIVESLLLLSQADAGKLQLELQPLDFSALLTDLAEDIVILAEPQKITVSTDLARSVIISGSPQFLRQIILNLFDNAVKYNRPGGEIRATLTAQGESAVFTIRNTGDGIPAAARANVFDRFQRGDRSRDRQTGGQGLGLALAREIARAHDGEIIVHDDEPGWTRFDLTLPTLTTTSSGIVRVSAATRDSAYTS